MLRSFGGGAAASAAAVTPLGCADGPICVPTAHPTAAYAAVEDHGCYKANKNALVSLVAWVFEHGPSGCEKEVMAFLNSEPCTGNPQAGCVFLHHLRATRPADWRSNPPACLQHFRTCSEAVKADYSHARWAEIAAYAALNCMASREMEAMPPAVKRFALLYQTGPAVVVLLAELLHKECQDAMGRDRERCKSFEPADMLLELAGLRLEDCTRLFNPPLSAFHVQGILAATPQDISMADFQDDRELLDDRMQAIATALMANVGALDRLNRLCCMHHKTSNDQTMLAAHVRVRYRHLLAAWGRLKTVLTIKRLMGVAPSKSSEALLKAGDALVEKFVGYTLPNAASAPLYLELLSIMTKAGLKIAQTSEVTANAALTTAEATANGLKNVELAASFAVGEATVASRTAGTAAARAAQAHGLAGQAHETAARAEAQAEAAKNQLETVIEHVGAASDAAAAAAAGTAALSAQMGAGHAATAQQIGALEENYRQQAQIQQQLAQSQQQQQEATEHRMTAVVHSFSQQGQALSSQLLGMRAEHEKEKANNKRKFHETTSNCNFQQLAGVLLNVIDSDRPMSAKRRRECQEQLVAMIKPPAEKACQLSGVFDAVATDGAPAGSSAGASAQHDLAAAPAAVEVPLPFGPHNQQVAPTAAAAAAAGGMSKTIVRVGQQEEQPQLAGIEQHGRWNQAPDPMPCQLAGVPAPEVPLPLAPLSQQLPRTEGGNLLLQLLQQPYQLQEPQRHFQPPAEFGGFGGFDGSQQPVPASQLIAATAGMAGMALAEVPPAQPGQQWKPSL